MAIKKRVSIPNLFFALFLLFLCNACEQSNKADKGWAQAFQTETLTYEHKGLKLTYPASWRYLHDEKGIIADRDVSFETEENSRITILFFKSYPQSYKDRADIFVKKLKLEESKHVKNYQRSSITISGYKAERLYWVSHAVMAGLEEVILLEISSEPYPILVQFQLFDQDIEAQQKNIIPFINGMSFDPVGVVL